MKKRSVRYLFFGNPKMNTFETTVNPLCQFKTTSYTPSALAKSKPQWDH